MARLRAICRSSTFMFLKGWIVGHTWNHLEQVFHWSHVLNLIQLINEIVEVKGVFRIFSAISRAFCSSYSLRSFLNQREHIPHTKDTARHTVWMEGFDIRDFFTCTSELDWFSSDVTNR